MKAPPEVFREYDIRGIVDEQLTRELAQHLGRAIGTFIRRGGGTSVVLGRDHRPSGVELAGALGQGLAAAGCAVTDIGVTPTPVGYWATNQLGADGGVQVTGSHNPSDYNGFKMTLLGKAIYGDDIQGLWRTMRDGDYDSGAGSMSQRSVIDDYVADLTARLQLDGRRLKVVVDAGNGTGGITAVPLYQQLGCEVIPLYCEPDGSFPNHHPDPTVESNLADLRARVAETSADVGIALDGDADRIGVIDRGGEVIWGDKLLILLARAVLAEVPGASIIGEVKCSKTLYDDIEKHGGKPVMWRTGHSLIKAKMKEIGAPLAGEMSGHIFYKHRYYGFDDAVYAGGRLLELLADGEQSILERLADLPATVSTPEIRVECSDAIKFVLVDAVRDRIRQRAEAGGDFRVVDIDGVRVEWHDGWGLVRPSNTQPILVLRFEAETQVRLEAIRALIEDDIAAARREVEP